MKNENEKTAGQIAWELEQAYIASSPLAQHNLELSAGFTPYYGYEDYEPNPYDGTYSEE